MNAYSTLSSKGRLVVPKEVRDKLGWAPGMRVELIARPGGVMLRAVPERKGLTADEALERIWARLPLYTGPRITDEDMHAAVGEMAVRQDDATRIR